MSGTMRRLPGIRLDAGATMPVSELPRMDVAVFVGFASTGPLHVPVAVHGVAQYAAVFGADAPLAWDGARGERVLAHLGAAVRGFFANGGRRCWVVRVARCAAAEALWRGIRPAEAQELPGVATANRFAVPGVLALPRPGAAARPALAQARCEGSWSDGLTLGTALVQQALHVGQLEVQGDGDVQGHPACWRLRTRTVLSAGDLVEFGDPRGRCSYAVVDGVTAAPQGDALPQASLRPCATFERLTARPAAPLGEGRLYIAGFARVVPAALQWPRPGDGEPVACIECRAPLRAAPQPGHWARWRCAGETVWLRIDAVRQRQAADGSAPLQHPTSSVLVLEGPAWFERGAQPPGPGAAQARVLALNLHVHAGAAQERLDGVGLTPGHRAAWWARLGDAAFFAPREEARPGGVASEVRRFALAAQAGAPPLAWMPLGVTLLPGAATQPLPQRATALERDGLSCFDAELFLDPGLADCGVEALPGQADALRQQREPAPAGAAPAPGEGRPPLFGVHAALTIGRDVFAEPSLLVLPDAVHTGWVPREAPLPPAGSPRPLPVPPHWHGHRGPCPAPASASLEAPDFGAFIDCATRRLAAPVLYGPVGPVAAFPLRLQWDNVEPGAAVVLEEATQPDFADGIELYRGPGSAFDGLVRGVEGVRFYRVHAVRGDERSASSNVLAVRMHAGDWLQRDAAVPPGSPAALPAGFEQQWLRVQRSALRLAAATGDLFVVLALPRHFRAGQAREHALRLRWVRSPEAGDAPGGVDEAAFGLGEARVLSHGALFFPWVHVASGLPARDGPAPRLVPPDGVAAGMLAGRALRRGAWAAPANEPLQGVVALASHPDADALALQEARVNLLHAQPRGLVALSADTLALDEDAGLRPIGVRRLLMLLRRLALRRGTDFVFEPRGPVVRRALQRAFEELLDGLFRRGAFAGSRPEQAFRVAADAGAGSVHDAEAGRLVVELRVAPSAPLRFVTVRLLQRGERLSVAEES